MTTTAIELTLTGHPEDPPCSSCKRPVPTLCPNCLQCPDCCPGGHQESNAWRAGAGREDVVDTTPPPAAAKGGELRPIVAPWLRHRGEFVTVVTDVGHRAGHTAMWHLVHSPFHAARFLKYTPRGVFRVAAAIAKWTLHSEITPLRREAVASNESSEWRALEKERKERVALRWRGLAAMTVLGLIGVALWWWLAPRWQIGPWVLTPRWTGAILSTVGVLTFGYIGRPLDKGGKLIPAATAPHGDVRLTNDIVIDALCSLGITGMGKPEEIELLYGVKPARAGYHIDLTLPRGVEATEVMGKRGKLSSALRRTIDTVWPSVGERHAGHLALFVSHQGMSTAKQRPWPLLKQGAVDLFKPVPMFTDQQGDWVELTIATTSGVCGAIPRMGKTYFLRELTLVGALDPRTEIYVFELKGTGDLSCAKLFAYYYSDSDEEEDIAEHLTVLRKLSTERRRRATVIKGLTNEECPRSEVTTDLASKRKLGLHPILVIVDECQVQTEHSDRAIREEFVAIYEDLVRRGPAVAIQVYLATQKVDAKSIPTAISSNASTRLCFKVNDATSNNQILGPGSYAGGLQATMFDFVTDKGIAYLKAGGPGQIVRTVFALDKVESEKVALRARALRETAGRLTGYAAGAEGVEEAEVVLLDDVRRVLGLAEAMHLTDIVVGLAALRPALYGSLDARSLGAQLRAAGMKTPNVYVPDKAGAGRSKAGIKREWLHEDVPPMVPPAVTP